MPETRARFLANTIGATTASNDFTLPDGVGDANQVISSNGTGGTTWATTLSAPTISSVTGSLNVYEDGVSEDGGVLTINGTDFGNDASTLSVQISGTTGFAVIAETTTISITSSGTQFTATFTGAETNYNHSSFAAGSTIYVKVTKSGLQTSAYATLGTAMTGDPSFQTTSTTASTHTGTLAATSLGSYGGQVAGGGDDSNTKLLLNFDRTGGTDIEDSSNTGGDGHKVTASGNATIKSSPFGDGKSAMYFDGSSYLEITNHADLQLNDSNFTVEFWMHSTSLASHDRIFGQSSTNKSGIICTVDSSGVMSIQTGDGGSNWISVLQSSSGAIQENVWHHIAIVQSSLTLKFYIDGKEIASGNNTGANNTSVGNFRIGDWEYDTSAWNFNGYLDEFRITHTAVYGGDFTVPTSRLTAITNTKLLIHSDQSDHLFWERTPTITGAIPKSETTNRGSGAHANFGSSAWYFDGSDDKIRISKSEDFNLFGSTSTNRTIDFWVYHTSDPASGGKMYLCQYDASSPYWEIRLDGANINFTGSGSVLGIGVAHGMSQNTWYHIAVTKVGTACKIYVDGVLKGSGTQGGTHDLSSNLLTIGSRQVHDDMFWNGYMDEIRISDIDRTASGQDLALSGTSFTPPTSAYTSDSNTTLLIHGDGGVFDDSSASDHTITPTGSYHSQAHGGIAPALTFPASGKKTGSAGIYFDGTGDYLSIPYSSDFDFGTGNFTIDWWFKITASSFSPSSEGQYMVARVHSNGSSQWAMGFSNAGGSHTGKFEVVTQVGTYRSPANNSFDLNTWYHIAVVRAGTGSNQCTVYKNGSSLFTFTDDSNMSTNATTLYIGAMSVSSSAYGEMTGYIDSLRISNTARTINAVPTKIYGAYRSQDVGTIQLNATAGTGGGALDYAELSGGTALSTYGLSLSSSGAITGTLSGLADNSNSGGVVRIRARANTDDNRVTTLGGSSFTGITQNDNKVPTLFNARRYVGNTTGLREISGFGFSPDLLWIKGRSTTGFHTITDSIRGAGNFIHTNSNSANGASTNGVTSLLSDGAVLGKSGTGDGNVTNWINQDNASFIAWAFKANGAPVSITSGLTGVNSVTQSASSTTGFSITKYTGTNTANSSFPHNLGGTPDWVIIKNLDVASGWATWHTGLGSASTGGNFLRLDNNNYKGASGSDSNAYFGTTGVTSTLIGCTNETWTGTAHNFICYAWKAVSGVSAFGTYEGTGVAHSVNIGLKPRFLMVKNIDEDNRNWIIFDRFRESSDTATTILYANLSAGDDTHNDHTCVFDSTGFSFTSATTHSNINESGKTFIYMAFA